MSGHDRELIRPHVSDGIQEYDNPLPKWWLGLFYLCIGIAVVYMLYFHVFGGPSLRDEYVAASVANPTGGSSQNGPGEDLLALIQKPEVVREGNAAYQTNCSPCHGEQGQGIVGPNLTDKSWIHGGSAEAIYKTIAEGVPEKGMLAWKPILGEEKMVQLTAFVVSLKGTNPPNPKAAEGKVED